MKLRLFPQERTGLAILGQMAAQIQAGVGTLSELLGAPPKDFEQLVEQMRSHEEKSTGLFAALLTNMRTSFINPLPREDLFSLGRLLNEASEKLTGAAELIALYTLKRIPARASEQLEIISRQAELTSTAMAQLDDLDQLEDYWLALLRLAKRADHTHRVFIAELLDANNPAPFTKYRLLADALGDAAGQMRRVATAVGSIIVKES